MTRDTFDLTVLVPGKDDQEALQGLLSRHQALGIREVRARYLVHTGRDPGCRVDAVEFLREHRRRSEHALVLFDHEGCGEEETPPSDLEARIRADLVASGWDDRAEVVVIVPELEAWVWSDSERSWCGGMVRLACGTAASK